MVATQKHKPARLAYSLGEIESCLPIARNTLIKQLQRRQLKGFRVGNKWMVSREEVLRAFGGLPELPDTRD